MSKEQISFEGKRILTVCFGNLHRSRAAEWLLHCNYAVESCGIWDRAVRPIRKRLVENKDKILVMNQYMANEIAYRYPKAKGKILVLDVEDPMCITAELILELQTKLKAAGFRTRSVKNADDAVVECRRWIEEKINAELNAPHFSRYSKNTD